MVHEADLRPVLRAAGADGDVVAVALALQAHGDRGRVTLNARLLREVFELTITEALAVSAWAEGPGDDEASRATLRTAVRTPLRVARRDPADGRASPVAGRPT
jgi:hypothetical protein